MDKSGCAYIVGIPLAIVFVFSLMNLSGRGGKQPGQEVPKANEVFTVGTTVVREDQLQQAIDRQMANMQVQGGDPLAEYQVLSLTLNRIIDNLGLIEFVTSKGIKLDEASIMKIYADRQVADKAAMRAKLEGEKKLKPGATEAEFLEVAKKEGRDYANETTQIQQRLPEMLNNPESRDDILYDAATIALQELYLKTTKVSDADLEGNYTNNTYKQIMVADEGSPEANKKKADQILAEIKAGKSFEAAMEQYIKTPPQPGKKKSDQTQELRESLIKTNETFKSLVGMKPGEVKLVDMKFGPVLYKFIGQKKDLPKDFATKKEEYRKSMAREEAFRVGMDENKKFNDKLKITWKAPGYEALYTYAKALSAGDLNNKDFAKLKEQIEPLLAKARDAAESDESSRRAAVLAQTAMMDQLWRTAKSDADKKSIADERLRILSEVLENMESAQVRLDLAQIYLDRKDAAAVEQVVHAAEANSDTGPMGVKIDNDIVQMLTKLKAAGLGKPEDIKKIEDEHARWMKDQQAELAAQAEAKAEEEKAKREAEAEAKKEEEAAKKNQPVPTPAPPGTKPPAGGNPIPSNPPGSSTKPPAGNNKPPAGNNKK